jgi:hypothetical protein
MTRGGATTGSSESRLGQHARAVRTAVARLIPRVPVAVPRIRVPHVPPPPPVNTPVQVPALPKLPLPPPPPPPPPVSVPVQVPALPHLPLPPPPPLPPLP